MKLLILIFLTLLGTTQTVQSGKHICEITQKLETIRKNNNKKRAEYVMVNALRAMPDIEQWPNILSIYMKYYRTYGIGVQALGYLIAQEEIHTQYYYLEPLDIIETMIQKNYKRTQQLRSFRVRTRTEFELEDLAS